MSKFSLNVIYPLTNLLSYSRDYFYNMNKDKKKFLRSILFRHLDGISLCGPISTLNNNGITQFIQENPSFNIQDLLDSFKCNAGYLNVTLRLLASQGWLTYNIVEDGASIQFSLTTKGEKCLPYSHYYNQFSKHFSQLINIDDVLFDADPNPAQKQFDVLIESLKTFPSYTDNNDSIDWEIGRHLEGVLLGPILVSLGMSDFFTENIEDNHPIETPSIVSKMPALQTVIDFFQSLGWIDNNTTSNFTDEGIFFLKRSSAYGVTVSYLPTFHKTQELIFGDPNTLWKKKTDGMETHVNRRMNVWGSGGAHSLYFKKIDEIVTEIFNQPLDEQPLGISDMGCGDGTLLKHLYNVVKYNTIRGENFDLYPLKIIGADFNKAARIASSITLEEAEIEHSILYGDISSPSDYANSLQEKYGLDLHKMLSVRSFLDHNRIYRSPEESVQNNECNSTGAFCFRGRWIPNNELKQNLIEHFSAWADYVSKFGLLILELHTISPVITSGNLGNTVATAYDGTHGFSDQYIIEADIMVEAAKEAGLIPNPKFQARFPNEKLATISINLFKAGN